MVSNTGLNPDELKNEREYLFELERENESLKAEQIGAGERAEELFEELQVRTLRI